MITELLQLPRGCAGGAEWEIWPCTEGAAQIGSGAGSRSPKHSISDGTLDSKDLGKTVGE